MADEHLWDTDYQDGIMDWSHGDINYRQESDEDDILAGVSAASFFTFDNLAPENLVSEPPSLPHLQIQPPTRVNTGAVLDQDPDGEAGKDKGQPWNHLAVGIPGADRNAARKDVSVSGSLTSNVPSDGGTSMTSLFDSDFASQDSCEICGFGYKNNSHRRKHILTHVKPHKCHYPDCKRSTLGFATQNDLERHNNCVHKNGLKKWWKCAYPGCLKTSKLHSFDRKDNFIAHIKRRHVELLTSDIESLVNLSEQVPTKEEIRDALDAKSSKSPGLTARSSRTPARRRKRTVKSEASSPYSPATPAEGASQADSAPSHSAPSASFLRLSPFPTNEFAYMGAGTWVPEQAATAHVYRGRGLGLGWQALADSYESGGGHAMLDDEMQAGGSFEWEGQEQAASPQPTFQCLPRQHFLDRRLFNSALSDQMRGRNRYQAIPRSHGATQGMEGMQDALVSVEEGLDMQRCAQWMGEGAFSTRGGSNVSFSQSRKPLASPSVHQSSSQRLFSYSPRVDLEVDMVDPFTYTAFRGHEDVDEG